MEAQERCLELFERYHELAIPVAKRRGLAVRSSSDKPDVLSVTILASSTEPSGPDTAARDEPARRRMISNTDWGDFAEAVNKVRLNFPPASDRPLRTAFRNDWLCTHPASQVLVAAVGFNVFFGYRLPGLADAAARVCRELLASVPVGETRDALARSAVIPAARLTLCVMPIMAFSPKELATAARCGHATAGLAPPGFGFDGAVPEGYGAHKLVVTPNTGHDGLKGLVGALRDELTAAGLTAGPAPRPHVSVVKITYSQRNKKEKAAANKLAKAAGFGRLGPTLMPVTTVFQSAALELLEIDTRPPTGAHPVAATLTQLPDGQTNAEGEGGER